MWYPPPVWVPIYLEQSSHRPSSSTTMMWPVLPREQNVGLSMNEIVDHLNHRMYIEDRRKFLLNKSVFDLISLSHYLELTDPKLLGWYLHLPVEDRKLIQEEGGLLRFLQIHPALEVSRHIVHLKKQIIGNYLPVTDISSKLTKSRQTTYHGVLRCLNCGTSCISSTKRCSRCNSPLLNLEETISMSEEENTLRLLPNNVKEELNLLKAQGHDVSLLKPRPLDCIENSNMSATQISSVNHQQQKHSDKEHKLCKVWKDGKWYVKDDRKYKQPSAQASFSLDRELEMQTRSRGVNQGNILMSGESSGDVNNFDQETSQYYSFNNTSPENTWGDTTDVFVTATRGSTETATVGELVENPGSCSAENGIFLDSESHVSNSSVWTDQTPVSRQNFNQWIESDKYNGMSDECQVQSSIEASAPGSVLGTEASLTVNRAVDASSDFRACFTFTQATEISTDYFHQDVKQDVSSGPDSSLINYDRGTQTVQRITSEKSTVTEVYMSDLDAICEEFGSLKIMETELIQLKNRIASSDVGSTRGGPESECQKSCCAAAISRATQAELRLLTLQFVMCKQHLWRRFYTSPLGETALQGAEVLPGIMVQILKSLENDYLEMKKKIKEGVLLDDLKPLSVDTLGLTEETVYSPAWLFAASLEGFLLETQKGVEDGSQTDQTNTVLKMETVDQGLPSNNTSPQCKSGTSSKSVGGKRSRTVSVLSQQSGDTKPGSTKDLNSSEAWFDAEEHLGVDCKEVQAASEDSKKGAVDVMEDEFSLLSVTNLPNNLPESDLQRLFERYHSSKVCISTCGKNRVAVVSVKSPTDAEAAVQQLHGRFIQGHMLHVEHIHKSPADGQGLIKEACAELSPAAHKEESAGEKRNILRAPQALQSSLEKLTNTYDAPNASGTFVPQHYCTMGSFNTIMGRLLERHPQMGRQRIVGALLELQAKNQGVLSGLPLRAIVDMTSDLLTRPATE